jgi:hypothetical protein
VTIKSLLATDMDVAPISQTSPAFPHHCGAKIR